MLRFKVTGLIPVPNKFSAFGNRNSGIRTVNSPNFSDDTRGVDLSNARNWSQGIRNDFKLMFNILA